MTYSHTLPAVGDSRYMFKKYIFIGFRRKENVKRSKKVAFLFFRASHNNSLALGAKENGSVTFVAFGRCAIWGSKKESLLGPDSKNHSVVFRFSKDSD